MATDDEQGVSPFPRPPGLFYKLYTDENVKAGRAPAPPLPVKGVYHTFGAKFDTEEVMIRPLKEQKIKQLYPDIHDRKAELKKLNRSIIVCFLELLDILILNPASSARNQKIADLSCLFINMHHLINEFRPHQARETLKVIMERQKKQREEVINQIQKDMDEARSVLKECGEFVCQASASIPHSMQIAQASGGVASGSGDVEEVKESLDATTSKVPRTDEVWRLVEKQNAELCNLVDSLIPNI